MGAIIKKEKKRELLSFVKKNMHKMSQRKIAKKLGIGKTTINRWCINDLNFKPKKYSVDEFFFDKLGESSSYILGFVFADGNVSWNPKKSYWALTITSSIKDKCHLENIRRIMGITKPLSYSKDKKSCRINISNKLLCKKLIKYGVIPNKSLIVKFPRFIPPEHIKHFIRGIIDGDGNVRYVNRKRSPYFEITISSGSKCFIKKLSRVLFDNLGVLAKPRLAHTNTYVLQYSCSKGKKLANWIYSDANIYLKRKFLNYKLCPSYS